MKFFISIFLVASFAANAESQKSSSDHAIKAKGKSEFKAPMVSFPSLDWLTQFEKFEKPLGPFEVEVDEGNTSRSPAITYLPSQYHAEEEKIWPLVILLHGFTGTAKNQDIYLGLSYRTSMKNFILLIPEGSVTPYGTLGDDGEDLGGNQFWNATDTCCDFAKTGVDDVGYLQKLIDQTKTSYRIDADRISVIGHSNGGFMASRLGCEMGDSFAAIVNLAGGTYKNSENCPNALPVNYLQIHAKNDETILYSDATDYSGAVETVNFWRSINRCTESNKSSPERDFVFTIPGSDTTNQIWQECTIGKKVGLWTIRDYDNPPDTLHLPHNPHVPLFQLNFMDAVLDFMLEPSLPSD